MVKKIANELVVDEKDVVEMNQRLGGDKSLNSAAGDEGDEEKPCHKRVHRNGWLCGCDAECEDPPAG